MFFFYRRNNIDDISHVNLYFKIYAVIIVLLTIFICNELEEDEKCDNHNIYVKNGDGTKTRICKSDKSTKSM